MILNKVTGLKFLLEPPIKVVESEISWKTFLSAQTMRDNQKHNAVKHMLIMSKKYEYEDRIV